MATTKDDTRDVARVGKFGNVGGDVALAYSPKGVAWCHFSLACQPRDEDDRIDTDADPDWYTVKAFGDLAEHAAECLSKGMRVVVAGMGQLRDWETDDGRSGTERIILADALGPDLRWQTAEVSKVERKGKAKAKAAASSAADEPF